MSLLKRLSSKMGEKTEEGNRNVARECLKNPVLLEEIATGLTSKDPALQGDCAEVMTKVAEVNPTLIVGYTEALISLLTHKTTRVRWEAMHALSLIASLIPQRLSDLLPGLASLIQNDKSTIVRDYAIETVSHFANTGQSSAETAFPILKDSLYLWNGKHRARALNGFLNVSKNAPNLNLEIRGIAEEYIEDNRGVVKKAAKVLIKAIDQMKL
jgi:hypothetical protein